MTSPASARSLGRHDEAFRSEGAIAYQRDIPAAEVHLLDTGHFALETHAEEISQLILKFLDANVSVAGRKASE